MNQGVAGTDGQAITRFPDGVTPILTIERDGLVVIALDLVGGDVSVTRAGDGRSYWLPPLLDDSPSSLISSW